ncbi:hypothetical protein SLS62_004603 [Diatrype stigma]|uniref:Alpha/beta hydrolase fold-3 domain-containing protein n=1 Tax=Diatrype stigma TaxID=117547 RepID=A0AAN9YP76_9PEZI
MAPLLSSQPFKAFYAAFLLARATAVFPWLLVRYSLKSCRTFPEWTLKLCIIQHVARELFRYQTYTQSRGQASLEADHKNAKERFALAEPAEASLYVGALAPGAAKPAAVGGLWYPAPLLEGSPNLEDEKVVLHFPGGAFVLAFGQEAHGRDVSSVMSKHLKATRTFFAQYRISTDSSTRFPAPLQDLVTFYHHILSLGVKPHNILLSGDSAAGNLVVGLVRYLEASSKLPLPKGAILWSPWVHVTTQAGADFEACRNSEHDLLFSPLLQWGAEAYYPEGQPTAEELSYISPLHHPFQTKVPLFIHAGTAEALLDDVEEFANQMKAVDGNRVRFQTTKGAPHNLIMSYRGIDHERQVEETAVDAFNFFEQAA